MKIIYNPFAVYRSFKLTKSWVKTQQKKDPSECKNELLKSKTALNSKSFNLIQNLASVFIATTIIYLSDFILNTFFQEFSSIFADKNSSFYNKFYCQITFLNPIPDLRPTYDIIRSSIPALISLLGFKLFAIVIPYISRVTISKKIVTTPQAVQIYLYLNAANTGVAKTVFLICTVIFTFFFLQYIALIDIADSFYDEIVYSIIDGLDIYTFYFVIIFFFPIYVYTKLLFFTYRRVVSTTEKTLNHIAFVILTLVSISFILLSMLASTLFIVDFLYSVLCFDDDFGHGFF